MKVFISCDIEGISGVVAGIQTSPEGKDYGRARRLMTGELNAAISGAFEGGATEVLVNDSHGPMTNILIEDLHPGATLITGSPKPLSMMQGIDSGFRAAMFVGYHARMGARGVLSHTISGGSVANIWMNDALVGETGINAGIAGHFGVPVILVTGDDRVAAEAKECLPHVTTAVVKWAITRQAAKCLTPGASKALIQEKARKALSDLSTAQVFRPGLPATFKIQFKDSGQAENASRLPYASILDPTTLSFTADDYLTAFKGLRAMIALSRA